MKNIILKIFFLLICLPLATVLTINIIIAQMVTANLDKINKANEWLINSLVALSKKLGE